MNRMSSSFEETSIVMGKFLSLYIKIMLKKGTEESVQLCYTRKLYRRT